MVKRIILIVAIAMIAFSGVALAGDTATVSVSATVQGTCLFNSGGTVSFTLDPAAGGLATGTVSQPTFWCTKNADYTISDDNGLNESGTIHRMVGPAPTDLIEYTFTYTTTGSGNGKTSPITMDIASTVVEAQYIDASAGSYTDTVTLTIAP